LVQQRVDLMTEVTIEATPNGPYLGLGQFRRRRGLVRQIALTAFVLGATVIEFHYVLCAAARSGCSVAG
jgi:hypothetical protein